MVARAVNGSTGAPNTCTFYLHFRGAVISSPESTYSTSLINLLENGFYRVALLVYEIEWC